MQAAHTASAYTGVLDCARKTWQAEGMRGFFRGHLGTLVREGPGNACYFGAVCQQSLFLLTVLD
jgi:hypothetical protein